MIHRENGGLSAARNTGIDWAVANSNSQWLAFIDSDDWINGTYLQSLYEAAVQEKCLIAACDFIVTNKESGEERIEMSLTYKISSSDFYNERFYNAQSACSKLFSKEFFARNNYRFQEGILYEDSAIIYQILFSQKNIAFTDKAMYFYFKRDESITNAACNPKKWYIAKCREINFNG